MGRQVLFHSGGAFKFLDLLVHSVLKVLVEGVWLGVKLAKPFGRTVEVGAQRTELVSIGDNDTLREVADRDLGQCAVDSADRPNKCQ